MNKILASAKFVVDNVKHVNLHSENVHIFAQTFTHEHKKHWLEQAPFDFRSLTPDEKLHFLLLFNALSFSYWREPRWLVEYKGKTFDRSSWCMIACLQRAVEESIPILSPEYLAKITKKDVQHLFRANVEIPLLEERWRILKEIGSVLTEKYQGNFGNFLKTSGVDALKCVENIAVAFPFFNDISTYLGKNVYFYKRAQLLVSDIYQIFNGKGYGNFKGINELTACADYKLPEVLRKLNIISYSPDLAMKIKTENKFHMTLKRRLKFVQLRFGQLN